MVKFNSVRSVNRCGAAGDIKVDAQWCVNPNGEGGGCEPLD